MANTGADIVLFAYRYGETIRSDLFLSIASAVSQALFQLLGPMELFGLKGLIGLFI